MDSKLLTDCPPLLRDFLFYMETIRGRSPKTVAGYYIDLRLFFRYLKSTKLPGFASTPLEELLIGDLPNQVILSVTLSDIYGYLNYVLSDRENSANTRSRKVASIRSFYKYITTKTGLLEINPVKDLDIPATRKTLPKYLTLEESLRLLGGLDPTKSPRDYCMVTLLLNCGMRVSELVGINLSDVRAEEGTSTLRLLGKGNKERIIYLNDSCVAAIENWKKARPQPTGGKDRDALFLSRNQKRLTTRRVEQIVEEALGVAGLGGLGYSPHKLRHTAATLLYQHGGVDVRVLKEILGHANISTTEIYTHISDRQMEDAANRSPLASRGLLKKEK